MSEKKYRVILPNPNGFGKYIYVLRRMPLGDIVIVRTERPKYYFDPDIERTLLTEEEIKQDFDWAWQFAELAED